MDTRFLILTGDGKGKTTSAFGMALRTLGHGGAVAVIQFIKHDGSYGEVTALRSFPQAEVVCSGLGFTPRDKDSPQWARHREAAREGWKIACERMRDLAVQTVICDEVFYPFYYGMISEEELIEAVQDFRQSGRDRILIMTGRNAPESLMTLADTVSRIDCVRHALQEGVKSQEKFEY